MVTDEHTPATPRSRRVIPRVLAIGGIVVLVLVALGWTTWALRSGERDTFPIEETFDRMDVEVDAGSVVIEATQDGTASLTATTEAALFADADVSFDVDNGELTVDGECSRGLWLVGGPRCRTDVILRVPENVTVIARSEAGGVTVSGLTGAADLTSSAGSVRVDGHTGSLRAHSSAGGVTVTGLSTDDAEITSSAGRVEVTAIEPPSSLRASSSAGTVTITLPAGESYNVVADTSAGNTTIDVPTDPSSPYRVEATSSAGNVTVQGG